MRAEQRMEIQSAYARLDQASEALKQAACTGDPGKRGELMGQALAEIWQAQARINGVVKCGGRR